MNKNSIPFAAALSVAALTFLVFVPSLDNGFVTWDDDLYVYDNFHIRSLDMALVRWSALSYYASNWHPVTWLSHAADYALWGLDPWGHHLTSVLLHSLNSGLLVLLILRLWGSTPQGKAGGDAWPQRRVLLAAAATGLLFGLHPLRVESVSWVAERKDVLCALFFLLSLFAYAGYAARISPAASPIRQRGFQYGSYLCSIGFFCLALLSKPMAVSLPLVLIVLDWMPFDRLHKISVKQVLLEKTPFILLSVISSVITMKAQQAGGAIVKLHEIALADRAAIAVHSLFSYLGKIFFPFDLVPFYPHPKHTSLLSPAYFVPIICILGITVVCAAGVKRRRIWSAVWGYYLVTTFPVLGLVQVGEQAMADRYTYLPTIGFFFLAGVGIVSAAEILIRRSRHWKIATAACLAGFVLLVGGLSSLSIRQMRVWKNDMTLWTQVLRSYPETATAYNNLGVVLLKDGKVAEARAMFARAVSADPSYAQAMNNLAICHLETKEYSEALHYALRAAAGETKNGDAYNTLGEIYFALNDFEKALSYYLKALSVRPDYPSRHFNIALALEKLGRTEESCDYWNNYLKLGKDLSDRYDVMTHMSEIKCGPR